MRGIGWVASGQLAHDVEPGWIDVCYRRAMRRTVARHHVDDRPVGEVRHRGVGETLQRDCFVGRDEQVAPQSGEHALPRLRPLLVRDVEDCPDELRRSPRVAGAGEVNAAEREGPPLAPILVDDAVLALEPAIARRIDRVHERRGDTPAIIRVNSALDDARRRLLAVGGQAEQIADALVERRGVGHDVPRPRSQLGRVDGEPVPGLARLYGGECRVALGHILNEGDDAFNRPVRPDERLIREVDDVRLGLAIAVRIPPRRNTGDRDWLAGAVHLIEHLEKSLAVQLRDRLANRQTDDIPPTDVRPIRRTRRPKHVLGPKEYGDGTRKLRQDPRELGARRVRIRSLTRALSIRRPVGRSFIDGHESIHCRKMRARPSACPAGWSAQ